MITKRRRLYLRFREQALAYAKKYRQKNKEKVNAASRKYHKENYPRMRKRALAYARKNRSRMNFNRLKWRHAKGISKRFKHEIIARPLSWHRKKSKALRKGGGLLTLSMIQKIYETNIKKYGTLTCYLCLKPIIFTKDNLEHKTPLSRGGDNSESNLAVACQPCNYSKNKKTEKEYRFWTTRLSNE